jgi:hypothetical protein
MTTDLAHFEKGVAGVVFHAFGKVLRNTVLGLLVGIVLGEALDAPRQG